MTQSDSSRPTLQLPHRKVLSAIALALLVYLFPLCFFNYPVMWMWIWYAAVSCLGIYFSIEAIKQGMVSRAVRTFVLLFLGAVCIFISQHLGELLPEPAASPAASGPSIWAQIGEFLFWTSLALNAAFDIICIYFFIMRKRYPAVSSWLRRHFITCFIGFDLVAFAFLMLWMYA